MGMKVNDPKYGSDFVKVKYWKVKNDPVVVRICPPLQFDDAPKDVKWSYYYKVHYGYKNTQGRMRAFQSPEIINRNTKMVESPDAANERIKALQAKLKEAKDKGDTALETKLTELCKQYNLDNNHYMNAIDTQGNVGVLKLRHKAWLVLNSVIKGMRDNGIDPLKADSGRFFVFRRTGTGPETTFTVNVLEKEINVDGIGKVKQEIVHKLTPDVLEKLEKEAGRIYRLFKMLTSEQVGQIVKESDLKTGKSRAVDEFLDTKENENQDNGPDEDEEASKPVETEAVSLGKSAPKIETKVSENGAISVDLDLGKETLALNTTAAAVKETKLVATQPQALTLEKTSAQVVSEMAEDDFLKSLEV